MFLRTGKPGFGFGSEATDTRPTSAIVAGDKASENLIKEVSR